MGTNYYWHNNPPCPTCGHAEEPKHIGKSSAGWCFSLRIYPEDGINSLDDWKRLFESGGVIRDEYRADIPLAEMLETITERGRDPRNQDIVPWGYSSWDEFHRTNYSMPGPKGLLRHRIDGMGTCVRHGEGTWDYCVGEFS
jgi:hypothetical protein